MYLNGEIWKVKLYPAKESEQDDVRPCLIVSPNSMNDSLNTIVILPMTTSKKNWPTRINIELNGKSCQACVEHIRSLSKSRFEEKLASASCEEMATVRKTLQSTFSM
jgi:mRNA interferase MazF